MPKDPSRSIWNQKGQNTQYNHLVDLFNNEGDWPQPSLQQDIDRLCCFVGETNQQIDDLAGIEDFESVFKSLIQFVGWNLRPNVAFISAFRTGRGASRETDDPLSVVSSLMYGLWVSIHRPLVPSSLDVSVIRTIVEKIEKGGLSRASADKLASKARSLIDWGEAGTVGANQVDSSPVVDLISLCISEVIELQPLTAIPGGHFGYIIDCAYELLRQLSRQRQLRMDVIRGSSRRVVSQINDILTNHFELTTPPLEFEYQQKLQERVRLFNHVDAKYLQHKDSLDSNWLSSLRDTVDNHPRDSLWELQVATFLSQGRGLRLLSRGEKRSRMSQSRIEGQPKLDPNVGPDFLVSLAGGRKMWIEAVAPAAGVDLEDLRITENGKLIDTPRDKMVLRLTNAIWTKTEKIRKEKESGLISSADLVVLAIDYAGVDYAMLGDFTRLLYDKDWGDVIIKNVKNNKKGASEAVEININELVHLNSTLDGFLVGDVDFFMKLGSKSSKSTNNLYRFVLYQSPVGKPLPGELIKAVGFQRFFDRTSRKNKYLATQDLSRDNVAEFKRSLIETYKERSVIFKLFAPMGTVNFEQKPGPGFLRLPILNIEGKDEFVDDHFDPERPTSNLIGQAIAKLETSRILHDLLSRVNRVEYQNIEEWLKKLKGDSGAKWAIFGVWPRAGKPSMQFQGHPLLLWDDSDRANIYDPPSYFGDIRGQQIAKIQYVDDGDLPAGWYAVESGDLGLVKIKQSKQGVLGVKVDALSHNPKLLKDILDSPPGWIQDKGDRKAQQQYLQGRVSLIVDHIFRYNPKIGRVAHYCPTAIKCMEDELVRLEKEINHAEGQKQALSAKKPRDLKEIGQRLKHVFEHFDQATRKLMCPVKKARLFGLIFDRPPTYDDLDFRTAPAIDFTGVNKLFAPKQMALVASGALGRDLNPQKNCFGSLKNA